MKELAELLNEMVKKEVIINYAIFGAMAQIRYAEPVATLDIDVLVGVPESEGLYVLNEISFLLNRYALRQKNLRALTWPEKVRLVEKARESVLLLKFSTKGLNPNKHRS